MLWSSIRSTNCPLKIERCADAFQFGTPWLFLRHLFGHCQPRALRGDGALRGSARDGPHCGLFLRRTEIERHLVIRAEARTADMQNMLSRYAAMQPSRLLFTGVDEVKGLGAAADTMIRSGIGATFFGTGPRIPDDLEEVSVAKLLRSLWAPKALAARAAAA